MFVGGCTYKLKICSIGITNILALFQYFIAIFIIFVTMLVGGILGYVFRGKVETTLENAMYASMRSYGNYAPVTNSWDETQRRLRCCGVRGPHDWLDRLPDSCCRESVPGRSQRCQIVVQQDSFILHRDGCLFVTKRFVKDHAVIIGTAGVIVACLMVNIMYTFAHFPGSHMIINIHTYC